MATAGLSFPEQFLGQPPDPFGPTPMATSGLGGLGTSTADMAVLGEALSRGSQFTPPQMRQAPTIAFSPSSNKVFVQGTVFDADDAAQALQSEQLLSAPGTGLPSAGDWVPLDAQAYGQYLESIRNPGLWRLAKKNFGRGVDVMQMLAGRGMQLAGAEETGGRIVSAQMEDLRKTAPFERMFTDIESGRGAVEWFVANLAQQGPNLLESVATALAGFAAGSAVGTPLAGPGAALAALAGKSTFKQSVLAAAKKKAAGETLDAAENKLLREAAGLAGATAASVAQNISTGASDIYGELREQGAGAQDVSARMTALAGSIPYALLETLPEFVLAGRVLGNIRAPSAIAPGTSLPRRGAELLRRGAVGGAIGGTLEGTTEAGQEALLLGLSGQDLSSPEGMNRLINSFAAGFGVGGPIGAVANLRGNKPANLLDAGKTTEPAAPTLPADAAPGTQGELFPVAPGEMAGPAFSVLPEPAAAPPTPQPGQMALFEPSAPSVADRLRRGVMPTGPGTQGQLGLVGGQVPPGYVPPPVLAPEVPAAPGLTPEEAAAQGALQFAPEAPAPTGNLGNALQQAIQRQQMARMQQQREAELAAQREAELGRLAGVAGRQRQLDLIQPERPALPMVPAEARPPRQLPLFPPGALPGPTRRQRAAVAAPLAQVPPGARRLRRQRAQTPQEQLRLPYIATDVTPEIARATWNDKRPASVRKWEALSEEAQQKWTDAIIAAKATPALRAQISREETQARLKPKEKPSAAQEGKLKQGRVAERAKGDEGVGARGDAGQKPTAQVQAGGAQAGGRGVALKRGKKAPVVDITQRRAEQIEEEDARREAEEDRAAREKIQADLKERHTKQLQELMRTVRDGRKVLSETTIPGSLKAKELQRLLNTFQDYIDRFNRLVSPDNTDDIQQTQADTFDRLMTDDLPRELREAETLSAELTKPKKEPPGPKAGAARAAAPEAAPALTPSTATVETETVTALDAEQQWNEERLPGDVAYADLPQAAKDRWAASDRSGAIQITILQELSDRLIRMTNTERLNYAIATASAAMDTNNIEQFDDVIDTIVEVAYFRPDGFSKDQQTEARNFLSDPDVFTNAQNASIQDSFVMNAEGRSLEATTKVTKTGTGTSGALKPWFEFAQSVPGMVQRLAEVRVVFRALPRDLTETLLKDGSIGRENLPDTAANEILGAKVTSKEKAETDPQSSPLTELLELITKTNNMDAPLTKAQRESRNAKLQALFSAANAASLDTVQAGPYFNADGTPRTANVDGKFRVLTKEEFANRDAIEQAAREQRKANDAAKKAPTLSTFDDWEEDGRFFRDDGTPLRAPLSIGRVRLAVANFLSKIFVKPTVHIYRDQADLKARNPQLHARASASRPQGDFDATPAVAYSFGKNEVIVFTDRVRTEQQLRFVLAHETLGHVGLRGIIPAKDFDKLMAEIYDQSPNVRLAVDAAMEARGLPKAEAVEEYLADFAASLDVSYIARIWNAIKNALNKLGVQFGDEAARYWVSQARRYVRTGQASTFTVQDVFSRMQEVESGQDPENTGRFSRTGDLRMDNVNAENLMRDNIGGLPDSFEDAFRKIRGVAGNTFESADKFLAQVFSLMNFRARENAGAYEVDRTLRQGRGIAMQVRNALNEKLGPLLSRAVEIPGAPWKFGGITADQYDQVNRILYAAQRLKFSQLPSTAELGRTPLYTVDQTTGELVPNAQEIERLYDMGLLTLEQMRDGFTYQDKFMREGKEVTETVRVAGIPGLTADSTEWKAYIAAREAMRDVELQLLTSRYLSFTQEKGLSFREIASVTRTGTLLPNEKAFFERMYRQYKKLYIADPVVDPDDGRTKLNLDSITKANDFLVAFNRALIATKKASSGDAVAIERNAKLAEFFAAAEADDVILNIEEFKDRFVRTEETQFLVQNRMKDLVVAEISNDGADVATRRNLAGGYVPVLRRGSFQIRVQAVANGKAVRLKQDYKDQLIYSQFDSRDEAVEMAALINRKLFSEDDTRKTYKVEAYNEDTMQYELMDVQLQAMPGNALDGIAAPPQLNLNEFVRGLRQFSITLPPEKLEEVVVALTAQNDRARQRLERNFVPGADPDAGRAIAEHIEARASTIAKIMMRPRLAELTNMRMGTTRALWMGDENRLNTLKQTWEATSKDPAATPEQKLAAKRDYDFYAFQYEKTNPKVKGTRVEKGNQYFNEAAQALHFLENNRNITEGDFASGNVASRIRAATSYLQLGGSIATGALNYIGSLTNVIPYMATYNQSTAFGAGFGFGPSFAAFSRALNQVGLRKAVTMRVGETDMDLNTAEFYDKVAEDTNLQRRIGITEDEARFLAGEIRDGEMVPALANATTNTARGRVSSGAAQKFLDGWMWTFNSTEQAVRRATGLSVYRLEKQRSLAAGLSEKTARGLAREAAVNALRFTLGDYSVMNRPPLWRNGVLSFVYIYKTFPTMSIQLFRRLPRSGQIYMLAALWMLGGLAALPFAEDIEDLIDTIAQGLGFTKASIRYEIAKVVDGIAPGMSPYFLRGFVNAYFPGNVADRVSLGNFIPGTGVLLAGANISRELTDLAGPAVSMLIGVGQSAVDIARLGSDRVTLVDVLRESPATLGRAMGDAVAYMQSGAIVDRRGYVVTPDVSAATVAVRMLGFYPSEATQQYDVIRVAKRMTDYQKEVVAGFRHAYIKAKLQGDNEQAAQIVAAVDAWNESAKGTATEIRNFTASANKALREASRPAGERFLKSAPKAAREDIETVADLLGY